MDRLYNLLYKCQIYFFASGLFLMLLSVSFHLNENGIELIWRNRPFIAVALLAIGLLLVSTYIQIDKYKIAQLKKEISGDQKDQGKNDSERLSELTPRQKEVYTLILSGKSNKEITSELFIEPSTLKTHINQIYKKLNISNRRELKKLNNWDLVEFVQ